MLEVIATILSSVSFNVALVVQSVDAGRAPPSLSFRPALLVHLLRRPLWLGGTALGLAAYALEVYALTRLPLVFVQPVIAAGVLVLPLAAKLLLDESPSRLMLGASVMIVAGVVLLGAVIPADGRKTLAAPQSVLILTAVGAAASYLALRGLHDPRVLTLIAGGCYGCTGIFSKLLAAAPSFRAAMITSVALACFAAIGFLAEMSALQKAPATRVAAAILGLMTVLPVVAGRMELGERWPHPALTVLAVTITLLPAMWITGRASLHQSGRGGV